MVTRFLNAEVIGVDLHPVDTEAVKSSVADLLRSHRPGRPTVYRPSTPLSPFPPSSSPLQRRIEDRVGEIRRVQERKAFSSLLVTAPLCLPILPLPFTPLLLPPKESLTSPTAV